MDPRRKTPPPLPPVFLPLWFISYLWCSGLSIVVSLTPAVINGNSQEHSRSLLRLSAGSAESTESLFLQSIFSFSCRDTPLHTPWKVSWTFWTKGSLFEPSPLLFFFPLSLFSVLTNTFPPAVVAACNMFSTDTQKLLTWPANSNYRFTRNMLTFTFVMKKPI